MMASSWRGEASRPVTGCSNYDAVRGGGGGGGRGCEGVWGKEGGRALIPTVRDVGLASNIEALLAGARYSRSCCSAAVNKRWRGWEAPKEY